MADLPTPEDLIRKLQDTPPPPMPTGPGGGGHAHHGGQTQATGVPAPTHRGSSGPVASRSGSAAPALATDALAHYATFEHVLDLIRANRDVKLLVEVEGGLRLAAYQPGRIEFTPTDTADPQLASKLGAALQRWTGNRWAVTVVAEGGDETIAEKRDAARLALEAEAKKHALVQAVIANFPSAKILDIRTPDAIAQEVQADALPEVDEEWDPFEDD